jgi:hypothetical protein
VSQFPHSDRRSSPTLVVDGMSSPRSCNFWSDRTKGAVGSCKGVSERFVLGDIDEIIVRGLASEFPPSYISFRDV